MDKIFYLVCFILSFTLLTACDDRETLAPVVESNWRTLEKHPKTYRVKKGDSLFAIAFRYNLDYQQIAINNKISSPYHLRFGQVLSLNPRKVSPRRPTLIKHPALPMTIRPVKLPSGPWLWPTQGPILKSYNPSLAQKGLDIKGLKGQLVRAAQTGVVAYAGDGLPGYGNLILLEHAHQFMSAYAYNARNLVHVGQRVRSGQPIAAMGQDNHQHYVLHFEIRKAGLPINPQLYLPRHHGSGSLK